MSREEVEVVTEFVVYGWSGMGRFDASALVTAASHAAAAKIFMQTYPFNLRHWAPHPLTIERLDRSDRKIFAVRSLDPLLIEEEGMPAATHVLWGGRVLCEDPRLAGMPHNWPAGQLWVALANVEDVPIDRRCAACWARVPEFAKRLGDDR